MPRWRPASSIASPANIRAAVEVPSSGWAPTISTCTSSTGVDPTTPIEDTIGALADLVAEGKIAYIGCPKPEPPPSPRPRRPSDHRAAIGYSLWTRTPRPRYTLIRELGIGLVPFSPLGHGFLTGTIRSTGHFDDSDWAQEQPPLHGTNFDDNLRIADQVQAIAAESRRH